ERFRDPDISHLDRDFVYALDPDHGLLSFSRPPAGPWSETFHRCRSVLSQEASRRPAFSLTSVPISGFTVTGEVLSAGRPVSAWRRQTLPRALRLARGGPLSRQREDR